MAKYLEKELLSQAEAISKIGIWELDIKSNDFYWSDGVFIMCGYGPQEFEVTYEKYLSIIHPDDRDFTIAQVQNTIDTGKDFDVRKRFITKSGNIKYINSKGKLIKDSNGEVIKLQGVFQDISETIKLEEELQNSVNELKARNQFIETILKNLPIGIAVNKIDTGEATVVNDQFAKAYGWSNKDLTDVSTFLEKIYPDETYRKEMTEKIMGDLGSGEAERMYWPSIKVTTSTGDIKTVDAKNIPLFEQNLMISTVVDVTEKTNLESKRSEISANLKALIENTPDIIYSIDLDFRLLTYNSAFENIVKKLGLGKVTKGIKVFDFYSVEKKELYSAVFLIVKEGKRYVFEDEIIVGGQSVFYDVAVNPIYNEKNEVIGVSIFSKDVTEKNQKERELERIKTNHEAIINSTDDLIWSIDPKMRLITGNKAFHKMVLITSGIEIVDGENVLGVKYSNNINIKWLSYYERGLKGEFFTIKYHEQLIDQPYYNLISFSPMFNADGEVCGLACNAKNITEDTLNLIQLEKTKEELQKIMDSSLDVICTLNKASEFVKVNAASERVWGYKPEELIGKHFNLLVHPDDIDFTSATTEEIQGGLNVSSFENRNIKKDGTIIPMIWSANYDEKEGITYCVAKDASSVKIKDAEIKRTNDILKNAQKLAKIGNYELNLNTNEVFCSDEIYNIYEIDRNVEPITSPQDFLKLTHPDDLETLLDFRNKIVETGKVASILHRIITKKNTIKYVRQIVELIYVEETKSNWLLGTVRDSTTNILTQKDLEASEKKYKLLFDNNPSVMFLFDFETLKIIDCNQEALELYGYTREEFLNLTIRDIRPIEDIDLIDKVTENENTYGQVHRNVWRHQKKNGKVINVHINAHLIDYDDKRCSLVLVTDITEKLEREKAIRNSEQQRELIMNAALDAIICIDTKGDVTFWNPQAEKIFDWKADEIMGKNLTQLIVPQHHRDAHDAGMKHYFKTHEGPVLNKLLELSALNKSGAEFPIELTVTPIRQGNTEFFCAFIRDITKRKNAEKLIIESEVKYRTMIESSMDAILLTIKNGEILSCNEAACQIFKMTKDEVIAAGRNGLVDISDARLIPLLEERERVGKIRGELTFKRKDGTKFPGEITSVVFIDATGQERTSMIIRDITDQKNAEKQILESNQRYDYVTKATFDAIWDWDLTTDLVYWGEGFKTILGYNSTENETDSKSWTNRIHPDDYERVIKGVHSCIHSETVDENWTDEYRFLKADGSYAVIHDKGLIVRNKKHEAIRMVGAMQDITKKKEESLRLKLLESVIINTKDSVLITEALPFDEPGPKILYVNEAFTKMTGYSTQDVIGKTPRILQGPKTDKKELKKLSKALRNWESCEITTINYKKNGDEFYINLSVSPVIDGKGSYTHWVAIERDVTEAVLAQQKIKSSLDERNTILERIDDGFFAVDSNSLVTYWNKRAEDLLGDKREDVIGNNLFEMFARPDTMAFHNQYQIAINENKTVHFTEYSNTSKKWFEVSAFASEKGLSVYFKDATDKKHAQKKLLELNQMLLKQTKELSTSNQELEQFAYVASHDLQEPLRMVTSFLTQIEKKYGEILDEKGKQYIHFAVDGAKRMRQIILDLLEFSRVGGLSEDLEEVNIHDLIKEIQLLYRKQITEVSAKLEFDNFPKILCHKTPIRQVLQNLISNALKYHNPKNLTTIKIDVTEDDNYWKFSVKDNGIGIEEEYFQKIFIIFQRLHNKDEYSGTGMGLAICKKIIESLGGEIWVEANEDKGSCFYFTIPKSKSKFKAEIEYP